MNTYFNEYEPRTAAWLRQLSADGLVEPGTVDTRSIIDVRASDLAPYDRCHFFAGIGGWSRALQLAGWPDDLGIWTGSCPCQPFSVAGRHDGILDARHLWPVWFRLIRQRRPPVVVGEQVASAVGHGWLDLVLADLEAAGYACGAVVLGAHSVGAPHTRQRLYWCAVGNAHSHARQRLADGRGDAAAVRAPGENAGTADGTGGDGRLADAAVGGLGADGSAPRDGGHADERGAAGGVGQPGADGRQGEQSDRTAARAAERECAPSRLADAEYDGPHRSRGPSAEPDEARADGRVHHGSTSWLGHANRRDGGLGDRSQQAWAGEPIPCRDNRWRLCPRGISPLVPRFEPRAGEVADGLPARVVRSGHPGVPVDATADNTGEARGMRLRGYGNAIVPQVAAEFLRFVLDYLR